MNDAIRVRWRQVRNFRIVSFGILLLVLLLLLLLLLLLIIIIIIIIMCRELQLQNSCSTIYPSHMVSFRYISVNTVHKGGKEWFNSIQFSSSQFGWCLLRCWLSCPSANYKASTRIKTLHETVQIHQDKRDTNKQQKTNIQTRRT